LLGLGEEGDVRFHRAHGRREVRPADGELLLRVQEAHQRGHQPGPGLPRHRRRPGPVGQELLLGLHFRTRPLGPGPRR